MSVRVRGCRMADLLPHLRRIGEILRDTDTNHSEVVQDSDLSEFERIVEELDRAQQRARRSYYPEAD